MRTSRPAVAHLNKPLKGGRSLEVFLSSRNSVPEQNQTYTLLYTLPENIIRSEHGIPEPRQNKENQTNLVEKTAQLAVKMPPPRVNRTPGDEQPTRDKTGTLDVPLKFLDQDYQELKKSCLTNKIEFVDEKFPSDSNSINPKKKPEYDKKPIKWLRPSQIVADPQFIVEGVSKFDYSQGSLENCSFLAPVGALTCQMDVLDKVMPDGQSFGEDYAGIFHFRFWRFGEWTDVVIDDKLPTIDGKLIFIRLTTSNEFWPALLEKAYAKICGAYGYTSGNISEALLDFTGGIHMHIETPATSIDLWSLMHRAAKAKALMACCTFFEKTKGSSSIVRAHAYSVTEVDKVICQEKTVQLVRMLNPWGRHEWTGDWSDHSPLWNKVSKEEQSRCRSVVDDGEFWISMDDFTKNFKGIDICCLSPDFLDSSPECRWTSTCYKDSWVDGTTAGGSLNNNKDSFWTNPQFRVRIEELDKECSGQCPENILVSLTQNHEKRNRNEVSYYAIGFSVFAIPPEMKDVKLPDKFFYSKSPIEDSGNFVKSRQVMKFFKLEPGEYLIVPATRYPKECAKFTLSIFLKRESHKRT